MDSERDPARIQRFFEVNPDAPRVPTPKAYVSFWIGPEIARPEPLVFKQRIVHALEWININKHPLAPKAKSETDMGYMTRIANLILRLYWIYEPFAPMSMRTVMDRLLEVTELEHITVKSLVHTNEFK